MNPSDIQLIRQFAENNDQVAFAQLVERYVDIAYSAAITCLGKDDLAHDACQLTFVELSKKARHLPEKVKLGGWIYITARNLSRKIQRTEIRRQQREQKYVDQMETQPKTEADWSRLAPDIHEALERLKDTEREAIILRYFQGKSLAEVGDALGVSADAARMRVKRALDGLNGRLTKKGITSTATALAAALPAHASLTAPTGMAASISTTVLANAGTAIATTTLIGATIAIMKAKALVITAVAATVVLGGGIYLITRSQSEREQTVSDPQQPSIGAGQQIETNAQTASDTSSNHPEELLRGLAQSDSSHTEVAPKNNAMGITPEYLKTAERRFSIELENTIFKVSVGEIRDTDHLTKKLQLRMGLNPDQTTNFHAILTTYRDYTYQQRKEFKGKWQNMMKAEGESMVNCCALEAMIEDGEELSPEQSAYLQSLNELKSTIRDQAAANYLPKKWHENESVLQELNAQLTPEQQRELATYIEEMGVREREESTLRHANDLAETLGLNEADRGALYDYLYEHPEASDDDIAEHLSPELRELMSPADD